MSLTVLAAPGCPGAAVLRERLRHVLAGRDDVAVTWREIRDSDEAAAAGMRGSPTLLIDGEDPFAGPVQPAGWGCRIYRRAPGAVENAPSLASLRRLLGPPPGG